MTCIVFDVETAPDPRIWDDAEFVEEIRSGLSAPANYKDPLKIEAYIDEAMTKAKDSAALSWVHGRIRAIGWMHVDPPIVSEPHAAASEDEHEVILAFAQILRAQGGPTLIGGFNCREFDVPFLSMRAAVHGIKLPRWWPNRRDWKAIVDPVDIFGRAGRLKDYLRAMGLPPKLGDGADAPDMPLDELIEYVKRDVECEALLIDKLSDYFPMLTGVGTI